jgi:hypothetical protein
VKPGPGPREAGDASRAANQRWPQRRRSEQGKQAGESPDPYPWSGPEQARDRMGRDHSSAPHSKPTLAAAAALRVASRQAKARVAV